jgi:dTDP-4-amino-4,6-dideoxygalactose transaminase
MTGHSALAINGGKPVRTDPFPAWPCFDKREEDAVLKVLRSGKWWQFAYGQGLELIEGESQDISQTSWFQRDFARYHDCEHGIAAANGTATLEIILRALNLGPGDEVIVPPYTFIASASSILQIGALPIFVDIDPLTLNLSPQRVEAAITDRTRAIMPVHFGGQCTDMDAINAIAKKHKLFVVEDAAHAHGSEWKGKKCGSLSDAGSFSFQNSKNMTAGEGGIITTNNAGLAEMCRSYLWAGREKGRPWYEHHRLGWNYRITEFQSAILRIQLERLQEQTRLRDANGRYLSRALRENVKGIIPQTNDERANLISYHIFLMSYEAAAFGNMTRKEFMDALTAEGIPCSGGYNHPLYRNPMFLNKDFWKDGFPCTPGYAREINYHDFIDTCPISEKFCRESVWLTQNLFLGTKTDMDDVVEAIAKIQQSRA